MDHTAFVAQVVTPAALDRAGAPAESVVRSIVERFQKLADFSGMGRSYEELFPNLRGFPVGNYTIFYRPNEQGVSIERILSGYRDIDALFQKEDEN